MTNVQEVAGKLQADQLGVRDHSYGSIIMYYSSCLQIKNGGHLIA